jgi:hypothetical protein
MTASDEVHPEVVHREIRRGICDQQDNAIAETWKGDIERHHRSYVLYYTFSRDTVCQFRICHRPLTDSEPDIPAARCPVDRYTLHALA